MKKTRIRHGFATLLIGALTVSMILPVQSMARAWNWKKDTGFSITYTSGYDSNILELSDDDIDRFENNELPGSTSPSTYDDLVQNFGAKFKIYSPKYLDFRRTRLFYTFGYQSFAGNKYNDRVSHSLFLMQDITRKVDLVASYFWIPQRYLRDYYDRDMGHIYPCEFTYHLYSAGLRFQVTKQIRLDGRYEGYQVYYNRYFTEYDSESNGFRVGLQVKVLPKLVFDGDVRYRWADNVGFDQNEIVANNASLLDAEYGDGSYGEEWFEYGLSWETPELLNRTWDVQVTHRLRHRYYTSDMSLEDDPFHAGREHLQQRLFLDVNTSIVSGLSGGIALEYEWRRTDSPNDKVPVVKDFDAYRAMLNFTIEIWD